MHKDHYTVVTMKGSSGFPNTAFSSAPEANHHYGANVFGQKIGVYGEAGIFESYRLPSQADSNVDRIGVCGRAPDYGVIGEVWYSADGNTVVGNGGVAVFGVCELEIEPRFTAASPPSLVNPLVPAAPVSRRSQTHS
jgi:hypothetical protein